MSSRDFNAKAFQNEGTRTVLGWREVVALPEWGIPRLRAKIDTGAKSCAIHVQEIIELEDNRLRFEVVIREKPKHKSVWVEATMTREARIKPSSGVRQRRYVVETLLKIGDVERLVEISLVCRKGMLCRMLVGRGAMLGFVVDPSEKYLVSGRPGERRKGKENRS